MKFKTNHINHLFKILFFTIFCFSVSSCTEQYVFQSNTFESILVVQANITNELKKQEVKISRSYRLGEKEQDFEKGANVYITDSENNNYDFELEDFSGLYVSKDPFQAVPGRSYQLNITTKEGKSYSSTLQTLTSVSEINVEPKVVTVDGIKGVQIFVTSNDPTASSKFYRFEYEETYKVISPNWNPDKLIVDPNGTGQYPSYLIVPRDKETRVCYTTKKSDDLILISNAGQNEDRINFPIRFIDMKSPILNERYSILVHQYVQSSESYTYYKTLKTLSTSSSLFSQVQPGFNYGNIKNNDDPEEKIVGYFEVSSISSKRIFFNFRDLFPADPYPPFYIECKPQTLANCWTSKGCAGFTILSLVQSPVPEKVYYGALDDMSAIVFVPSPCGDCTSISSNIKPAFWID